MNRDSKLAAVALALLILPYFLGLGHPDLWDANESLYAEPPREAVETGEWLAPTMNYEPWFVKPPGVTWITIPFYLAFGSNEFGGRLPMAIFAAATILLTFAVARRLANRRAALLAAAFLATTAKFFMFSRQFAGDVFLTTILIAAGYLYLRWFESEGRSRWPLWLAAAILGAGSLVKGPVSLLLPALFVPLHLWLARRTDLFRRLRPLGPIALGLALAAPWFVYMTVRFGDAFVHEYFLNHHLARAFTAKYGGGRGLLYYPGAWLGDALPWSLALPGALYLMFRGAGRGAWRRDPRLFPLLWCVVVFALFSLSEGKRSVYMLPLYPTVAILLGITVDRALARTTGWRDIRYLLAPVLVAVALMIPLAIWLMFVFPEFRPIGTVATALLAALAGMLVAAWRRRSVRFACVSSFALLTVLAAWVALNLDDVQPYRPARDFARTIAAKAAPSDACGRYSLGLQSLTFYGHRPFFHIREPDELVTACREADHTWLVIADSNLPILTDAGDLETRIVDEGVYLQVSLPALLGNKEAKRKLLLVEVTPRPASQPPLLSRETVPPDK